MEDDWSLFRSPYVEHLSHFKDEGIIKILSGVRRCGKSTVLEMYRRHLLSVGVAPDRIITRLYTSMEWEGTSARDMHQDLQAAINRASKETGGWVYLLLDEVQEIEGWERPVNSLLEAGGVDIYVTGSNSKLLSSEISTYLTGRFVEIPVYTLSFPEFMEFRRACGDYAVEPSADQLFEQYLRWGGFPFVAKTNHSQEENYQIVDGIYSTVVTRDIARRHAISNVEMFNRVTRFVLENLGKCFSAKSIFDFFKSQHRSISIETIYNYLAWLEEAFIVYRCSRYDIQGKDVLKTQEKYYLSDISFKYSLLGFSPTGIAAVLENIVYLELRRQHFQVYVGKLGSREIDFVAIDHERRLYVQVCRTLPEDSDRELGNLRRIRDNYPKFVVTLDRTVCGDVEGIQIVHIIDFIHFLEEL